MRITLPLVALSAGGVKWPLLKNAFEREPTSGGSGPGSGPALLQTIRCNMSTPETFARIPQVPEPFVFPDPPEDPEDKMTSFDRLTINGNAHYLAQHLGNPETTLVAGDRYLALAPTRDLAGVRYPDLLVAFDVDPAAYKASNAYVISEQGKPPDLVLEIASRSTGKIDVTDKRRDYAALGIGEYWRFDETGRHHGTPLAGDLLVDGEYVALDIEELPDGGLQGYSAALDLRLRWEDGELVFYDPATGRPIATLPDERARADAAEAELAAEREARAAAEARVRELEELLRRQDP